MPDFDEFVLEAIDECRDLLGAAEPLIESLDAAAVDELFRRVHTLKSNTALIPNSKSLSLIAQTVETLLSRAKQTKQVPSSMIDDLTEAFQLMSRILETLRAGESVREFEAPSYRCVAALRLKSAA